MQRAPRAPFFVMPTGCPCPARKACFRSGGRSLRAHSPPARTACAGSRSAQQRAEQRIDHAAGADQIGGAPLRVVLAGRTGPVGLARGRSSVSAAARSATSRSPRLRPCAPIGGKACAASPTSTTPSWPASATLSVESRNICAGVSSLMSPNRRCDFSTNGGRERLGALGLRPPSAPRDRRSRRGWPGCRRPEPA